MRAPITKGKQRSKVGAIQVSSKINQYELDDLIEAIRNELRLSFWQGFTLSLAIFVLSLSITLLHR